MRRRPLSPVPMSGWHRVLVAILAAIQLTGCATLPPPTGAAGTRGEPTADEIDHLLEAAASPASGQKPARPGPASSQPVRAGVGDTRTRIRHLLPPGIQDAGGWARDMATAFAALRLAPTDENLCAVIAVTEQESSFQADPPVAGLPRIVRAEIDRRAERYHIPAGALELALSMRSPDGHSYRERIAALRTENDLNRLYADMMAELPFGRQWLAHYNPVRTGGPMQVSLAFAERQVREKPYPYPRTGSLREELFSRRGGLYFGAAYLLDYPATYRQMRYRFADFNAGRYASRNAAFQQTIGQLTGIDIEPDGDLLRYRDGTVSEEPSQTQQATLQLANALGLGASAILADLRQEKSAGFEQTELYRHLFLLAQQRGLRPDSARLPEIRLNSPKITRGLTTARFAQRVNERFNRCLRRR